MEQMNELETGIEERDTIPIPFWNVGSPIVEVVLVEAGLTPWLVAGILAEVMSITITDPRALHVATPITLYRELDRQTAEELMLRLQLAGAVIDLCEPRPRTRHFRRPRSN
jgi:hypothetical protein